LSALDSRGLKRQVSGSAFFNDGNLDLLHRHCRIPLALIRLKNFLAQP
jgi:hypothetical protein